jgi:hypothetical protein
MMNREPFEPPGRQDARNGIRSLFLKKPWVFSASWRLGGKWVFLSGLLIFSSCFSTAFPQTDTAKSGSLFPHLLLCDKAKNRILHVARGKVTWDYSLDGPLLDVQPQPLVERYLVTGGTQKVFLLRKVWKGCRVIWDWSQMEGVSIPSAVAVDWDPKGEPDLILAADAAGDRIFLADAKSKNVKVRWEYKLPAAPLRVRVCPDSNNFLVLLKDSTVEEIQYQEDKVVWSLGPEAGLKGVCDAVRGPWGHTYVAETSTGDVACFDHLKNPVWRLHLPFAPAHSFQNASLSLYKKKGKRTLMVAAHWEEVGGRNVIYLLNAETGKVMEWSDRSGKSGYPPLLMAVPDLATYERK